MIFTIDYPTKVLIGEECSAQTGSKLKEFGVSKALCVYDPGIKSAGLVENIIKSIKDAGIQTVEYGEVMPDPYDKVVNAAGALGRKEDVDVVVGIGGGSSLDAAKAANVLLGNPGPINNYLGMGVTTKPGKLLVLMPTTSGTGSEISQVAAIGDSASGKKIPVFGPNCIANLAIVDPLLTVGLPPHITAYTGVDALAHAIEAYTSAMSTPISDIVACKAISLVNQSLVTAVTDGSNVKARTDMSFASTLAGMAFLQAPPHLGHSIGIPIGARYHMPHGLSIAIILPGILSFLSDVLPEKIKTVGKLLGLEFSDDATAEAIGLSVNERLRAFNREVGIPTLKQSDVSEADLESIAEEAMEEPLINIIPKKTGVEDILYILRKEYQY